MLRTPGQKHSHFNAPVEDLAMRLGGGENKSQSLLPNQAVSSTQQLSALLHFLSSEGLLFISSQITPLDHLSDL